MKIAYILFIASINVLIYVTLYTKVDKKRNISRLLWWLWATAFVIIACHIEIFKLRFLLPFDDLLAVLLLSLAIAAAHLISIFYIERIRGWDSLSRQTMRFLIAGLYFNLIAMYVIVLLLQCASITAIVERYYK
jgi:hypothetical protein